MSTRPFPNRSAGTIRAYGDQLADRLRDVRTAVAIDGRPTFATRRRIVSQVADQPWRLGIGMAAVLAPAVLFAVLGPAVPVTTPGIVFILAVAGSTYLADRVVVASDACPRISWTLRRSAPPSSRWVAAE
jgi:hypothetical protein